MRNIAFIILSSWLLTKVILPSPKFLSEEIRVLREDRSLMLQNGLFLQAITLTKRALKRKILGKFVE